MPAALAIRFSSIRSYAQAVPLYNSNYNIENNYTDQESSMDNIVKSEEEEEAINCTSENKEEDDIDQEYPGTSVERLRIVQSRVAELNAQEGALSGPWEEVRRKLLWAGGLKDLPDAMPGKGYTGHSFNDYNHVDLTTMNSIVLDNKNDGRVRGIAIGNMLGRGIRIASLPDAGDGGSWTTCQIGCHNDPPQDVAHVQFRSRIAFKLVWSPVDKFQSFVLVNDDGKLLASGTPKDDGRMPPIEERIMNYRTVYGSKYAVAADNLDVQQTETS